MILEPEKFRSFEHAGWQEIPTGYHEAFGSLTQQAIKPLLSAIRLKKGMSFLDIACGPGYVADWVTAAMVKPADYSIMSQLVTQAKAVALTIVWSGAVAFIAYKIADILVGMRVPEEEEREGLDITAHGESAYN